VLKGKWEHELLETFYDIEEYRGFLAKDDKSLIKKKSFDT
jgi:hypothetical protein